jgi:hypothetical protein
MPRVFGRYAMSHDALGRERSCTRGRIYFLGSAGCSRRCRRDRADSGSSLNSGNNPWLDACFRRASPAQDEPGSRTLGFGKDGRGSTLHGLSLPSSRKRPCERVHSSAASKGAERRTRSGWCSLSTPSSPVRQSTPCRPWTKSVLTTSDRRNLRSSSTSLVGGQARGVSSVAGHLHSSRGIGSCL